MTTGMVSNSCCQSCNSVWIRGGHTFDAGARRSQGVAVKPAERSRGAGSAGRVALMSSTSAWRRRAGVWTAEQTQREEPGRAAT